MKKLLRFRKIRTALQLIGMYKVSGPEFMIIGAPKAGSTTLFWLLQSHHQIVESFGVKRRGKVMKKELRFFNKSRPLSKAMTKEYQLCFLPDWSTKNLLRYEGTPDYLECISCPKRIFEYSATMKLIVILREPSIRAFSHWKMYHYRDRDVPVYDPSSFKEAVSNRESSYVRKGQYADQIERYLQYFPSSQLLILDFNELSRDQQKSMDRITDFLNISRLEINYMHHNVRSTRELDPNVDDAISELKEYYLPHNKRLKAILSDLGVKMSWLH